MISSINTTGIKLFTMMICMSLFTSCKQSEYQGYVYDRKTHLPLKDVLVRYHRQEVRSDERGHFTLNDNDDVSDAIIFYKKGYIPDTAETILIHSGETMDERFKDNRDTIFLSPVTETEISGNSQVQSNSAAPTEGPISSAQFSKFYKRNDETGEYTLVVPEGFELKPYADAIIPVHESPFGYDIKPGDRYLTGTDFKLLGVDCKIIVYNVTGENDSPVLNIQLDTYNKEGKLIDVLLLDSRFTFEVVYYRDFIITESGIIKLKLFEKDQYTYNEQGDITGSIEKPKWKNSIVTYKLQPDGKFVKLAP